MYCNRLIKDSDFNKIIVLNLNQIPSNCNLHRNKEAKISSMHAKIHNGVIIRSCFGIKYDDEMTARRDTVFLAQDLVTDLLAFSVSIKIIRIDFIYYDIEM